ncbi:MAG: pseudouridine synthase [Terriglobales bacterium]
MLSAAYNLRVSQAPTPARIRLPRLDHPPATIFEFLCARFSHIPPDTWRARIAAGDVRIAETPISIQTPYQPGVTVFYFREVAAEPGIPFAETVLHEDDRLLVADKPHFLPVTPAGGVVNECLLFRLQRRTGLADLAPIHRLDRDTAGLVLFAKRAEDRAAYARLFAEGKVERKYLAIAKVTAAAKPRQWLVESRIEPEPGSFRMRSVGGEVNARTHIELLQVQDGLGRFELRPATGKKHQLRLHMLALGFPILHDPFYPELSRTEAGDFFRPLQLLASELKFDDPTTRVSLRFETRLQLITGPPS